MYGDRDYGSLHDEAVASTSFETVGTIENIESRTSTPTGAANQEPNVTNENENVTEWRFMLVSSPPESSIEEQPSVFSSEESDSEYTSANGSSGNSSYCESGNTSPATLYSCELREDLTKLRQYQADYQSRIDDLCEILCDVNVFVDKELSKHEDVHDEAGDFLHDIPANEELPQCSHISDAFIAERCYGNAEVQTSSSLESVGSFQAQRSSVDSKLRSTSEVFGHLENWSKVSRVTRSAIECICNSSSRRKVTKTTLKTPSRALSTNCLLDRKKTSPRKAISSKKPKTLVQLHKEFSASKPPRIQTTPEFLKQFHAFAKLTNTQKSGVVITKYKSYLWLKTAGLFGDGMLDEETTAAQFVLFAGKKVVMNVYDYLQYLQMISQYKEIDINYIIGRLTSCSSPEKKT